MKNAICTAALTLAIATGPSFAVVIAQYNMGEDDPGAIAGAAGQDPTVAAIGSDLTLIGSGASYNAAVPAGGSTLSMEFAGDGGASNGTDTYYYSNAPTTDLGQDFSYSLDANFSSTTQEFGFAFVASLGGNFGGMAIIQNGANIGLFFPGVGGGTGSFTITPGTWYNLSVSWDAANTMATLSVDGSAVSTLAALPANGQIVDAFTLGGNFRGTSAADAPVPGSELLTDFEGAFDGLIDNVGFDQIPEPSSFVLLGLASLSVLRRRRG